MTNKIKYIIFFFLLMQISSCKQYFTEVTAQYKASQYVKKAFEKIESCKKEYYKYHPNAYNLNVKSKTCSRVENRMCVINNYCKGDKNCNEKAWRSYPSYNLGGDNSGADAEHCMAYVQEIKEANEKNKNFKGYFYCKTEKRDDEFCKKHGI